MTKEIVRQIEWSPLWDAVSSPQIFSNGHKIFLIYSIDERDEKSVDTITKLSHGGGDWRLLALVKFDGWSARFGIANDEVWQGLSYYSQGVGPAQVIENSNWIEEVKQIHKIHPGYDESGWKNLKHYVLMFKEELVEVIATGHNIEVFETTIDRLGQEVLDRMNFGEK